MTALSTDGSEEKNVNFSSINKARCFVESFYIKMRYYYFPGIFFFRAIIYVVSFPVCWFYTLFCLVL